MSYTQPTLLQFMKQCSEAHLDTSLSEISRHMRSNKSLYVRFPGFHSCYVRCATSFSLTGQHNRRVVLANIQAHRPGTGNLGRIIDFIERHGPKLGYHFLEFELVGNTRLADRLARLDFQQSGGWPPSFMKEI